MLPLQQARQYSLLGRGEYGVDSIISALLSQGAVGIIAGLALFLLDRSYKDRIKETEEGKKTYQADRAELISVIRENAKTVTALQLSIETSTRAIEALIYDRPERPGTRTRTPRSPDS